MPAAVFKYILETADISTVKMPMGAKILSVGAQRQNICVWALVDPSIEEEEVHGFRIFGTGHPMPEDPGLFLGSVHMDNSRFIFHVFKI